MKNFIFTIWIKKLVFIATLIISSMSWAVYTELGSSFQYRKTSYDEYNFSETQSTTASISLYFWERVGLELSYTEGRYDKIEGSATLAKRTTSQKTKVYGADILMGFADRKSAFQPYAKVGYANTHKEMTILDTSVGTAVDIPFNDGWAASYGVGAKFFFTESLAIRLSYDIWETPSGNENYSDQKDNAARVGITWTL